MRRATLAALLVLAWLSASSADAQPPAKVSPIGVVWISSRPSLAPFLQALPAKTARALGLTIPRSLLLRADHVIQ